MMIAQTSLVPPEPLFEALERGFRALIGIGGVSL